MIIRNYIKEFENLGFGLFVHYGLYSILGCGEWNLKINKLDADQYNALVADFEPDIHWAQKIVSAAKQAGCKYITLTTRHHDGFSLYDTCGLNIFDAPHSKCKRDIVREFVDACNKEGIIPFFYHTLLDWHEETYRQDFHNYLVYLRKSIEILCTQYGKIGGFWFDGMWDKPNEDWEEDALYGVIRKHQPDAMIINNTGLHEQGKLGHIELDSVTFERGRPQPINLAGSPKYIASEMCEVLGDLWGYAREDFNYKSPALLIKELCECRKYGANMLLNIGPKENGLLRSIDAAYLEVIGEWVKRNEKAIRNPRPTSILVEGKNDNFILQDGDRYYLFCFNLSMSGDPNVALRQKENYTEVFNLDKKVQSVTWLDNGDYVNFSQQGNTVTVHTVPFQYGRSLVVRVAEIVTL